MSKCHMYTCTYIHMYTCIFIYMYKRVQLDLYFTYIEAYLALIFKRINIIFVQL